MLNTCIVEKRKRGIEKKQSAQVGQSKVKVATRSYQPDLIGLIGNVPRLEFQELGRRDSTYVGIVYVCILSSVQYKYPRGIYIYVDRVFSISQLLISRGMSDCNLVDL